MIEYVQWFVNMVETVNSAIEGDRPERHHRADEKTAVPVPGRAPSSALTSPGSSALTSPASPALTSPASSASPALTSPLSPALTSPAVAGITRLSATDTVRARIALAIELGLLAPGEQLPSDAEVASALDVSEITARRALKSLAEKGVVTRLRGRNGGTFVAEQQEASRVDAVRAYRGDAAEVHRLIDQRILIECTLVHFAALNASDDQLDVLAGHVQAAAAAADWSEYHAADERFHLGVAASSGLEWAIPHYREALGRLYGYFLPYPIEYLHGANQDHANLVEALRRHDTIEAVAIIDRHVSELHRTMFVGLDDERATSH